MRPRRKVNHEFQEGTRSHDQARNHEILLIPQTNMVFHGHINRKTLLPVIQSNILVRSFPVSEINKERYLPSSSIVAVNELYHYE